MYHIPFTFFYRILFAIEEIRVKFVVMMLVDEIRVYSGPVFIRSLDFYAGDEIAGFV